MRAASMAVKPHGMLTRGVSGIRGTTLVLSFPGQPEGLRRELRRRGARARPCPEAAAPGTDGAPVTVLAGRLSSLIRLEHTLFALPYAYVGAIFAVDGRPSLRRPLLDHGGDGRRPLAGDGAEPPRRRRDRRAQPAHRPPRDPRRAAVADAGDRLLPRVTCDLRAGRLAARADHALARADSGDRVRDLPVPEAVHAALPPVARCRRRPRAGRRLGGDHQRRRPEGVPARRRGVLLDRRVRRHLRDHGLRARSPRGPPLDPGRLRHRRGPHHLPASSTRWPSCS